MNARVIMELENVLARAREGEIAAVAIATLTPDLSTANCFVLGDCTLAELLGSIDLMHFRLMVEGNKGRLD